MMISLDAVNNALIPKMQLRLESSRTKQICYINLNVRSHPFDHNIVKIVQLKYEIFNIHVNYLNAQGISNSSQKLNMGTI